MSDTVERGLAAEMHLYYDLFVPEAPTGPLPLLVAAHGYGGDKASMMRAARRITGDDFVVASVQGPHEHIVRPDDVSKPLGYGFGWLTNFKPEASIARHHGAVRQIILELSREGVADANRVFLLGFSQPVALNFRFAFTDVGSVQGVVAVCGGIPGDWNGEGKYGRGDVDVLYVGGREDEFYPPARLEANAESLRSRARHVDLKIYDGGHVMPRGATADIRDWLLALV